MFIFWVVIVLIIVQRGFELWIAKRNERWMKGRGAVEFGQDHYKWIVLMHGGFFLFLIGEVVITGGELIPRWPVIISLFLTAQVGRIWALTSLGRYWNTKIIVLPGEKLVRKGPYQWVNHPNYWIVAIELLTLPILFQAWITAVVFTVLNGSILLLVRIPKEEEALKWLTNQEIE
ncbi:MULTISPECIES: isoprenylcysteine carboxyl methyltransferase family protein [Bacillaceae]|uniref:Isoprenylcysteine carboxyl methyltransferase n=1 Tax=Evansella alkalicola TaxID=745819 RepID=A0ABS6JRN8_9BACI|nr:MULTISPECIES: isoprenylcysteine carboxylmethyltransferase family protein [Bacillaceae]MBU9721236.1 hypothetical protein [Bacillus alkalicola]